MMTKLDAKDMSDGMSRFSFWLGEAYFWGSMIIAYWAALSGAPWGMAFSIGAALSFGNLLARWLEWRDLIRARDPVLMVLNWTPVLVALIAMATAFGITRIIDNRAREQREIAEDNAWIGTVSSVGYIAWLSRRHLRFARIYWLC